MPSSEHFFLRCEDEEDNGTNCCDHVSEAAGLNGERVKSRTTGHQNVWDRKSIVEDGNNGEPVGFTG